MPVTPTYPGVYVEEIPSGVRTITGVATSITAFIGRARRGPTNDPVTITSFSDFERVFGGLQEKYLMSYAVRDFFLNGGSQAIIVRLVHPNFATDDERKDVLAAAKTVSDAATHETEPTAAKAAADHAFETIDVDHHTQAEKDAAKAVAGAVDRAAGGNIDNVKNAAIEALAEAV